MDDATPRPSAPAPTPRRRFGCVAITLICLAGGAVLSLATVLIVASSSWKRFERSHRELSANRAAVTPPARLSAAATVPGNAWDDYLAADVDSALSKEQRDALSNGSVPRATPEQVAAAREALEACEPLLEHVRAGTRRAAAAYPLRTELGAMAPLEGLTAMRLLGRALQLSTRVKWEAGDRAGALAELECGFQLAADVADIRTMIGALMGSGMASQFLEEAVRAVQDPSTTAEELARLEDLLAKAEAAHPTFVEQMEREHLMTNETLRAMVENRGEDADPGIPRGKAAGVFVKLMAPDLDAKMRDFVATARAVEGKPWAEAHAILEAKSDEVSQSWNVFAALMIPALTGGARNERVLRARYRLVRAAALERLGRLGAGHPADPFLLRPLAREARDGGTVFWSPLDAGPDSGTGDWQTEAGAPGEARDLVLEIAR